MRSEKISLLIMVVITIIYVVNFVQMCQSLINEDWGMAVVKAIGVLTAVGSIITVWF